jgi:hypothetical protein
MSAVILWRRGPAGGFAPRGDQKSRRRDAGATSHAFGFLLGVRGFRGQ